MTRYIDADVLKDEIQSLRIVVGGKDVFCDEAKASITRIINEQPTADVVPVVRGHYITDDMGDSSCSECGEKYVNVTQNFCPNCGADMRGEIK